jgi:hypothetical protein
MATARGLIAEVRPKLEATYQQLLNLADQAGSWPKFKLFVTGECAVHRDIDTMQKNVTSSLESRVVPSSAAHSPV